MKQKSDKIDISIEYELISELLRSACHVRGLARMINANQMTVSRALRKLTLNNILDFKQEGRDKVYLLKKTIESKSAVMQAEWYLLLKTLSKYPRLRTIIETIQNKPEIRLAILFGSYAKGTADEDSDIDIYIETENREVKDSLEKTDSLLAIKIGAYDRKNLLIQEIWRHHVVLKGVEEYHEKNGFFEDSL